MAHAILERLPMTMGYFRLIHRCFGRANSAALLEGTGVSERDLANPSAEISLFQQVRQVENVNALHGAGWALSQPELWNPSAHGAIASAMLAAPTIADSIEVLRRYGHVRAPFFHMKLKPKRDTVVLDYELTVPLSEPQWRPMMEIAFVAVRSLVQASLGRAPGQMEFSFAAPRPDYDAQVRKALGAHVSYEAPLTSLVWLTSIVSVLATYIVSYLIIPDIGDGTQWWKLSTVITCGTLAGAIIPELVKIFTSVDSKHVREVVTSSREGGASLNILSGLVAGNFSAYWLGIVIMLLMSIAYGVSTLGLEGLIPLAPAVFAFGLVAFGFLGMGPVTIAVDSYGPVTDNAQSVFELSTIEQIPGIAQEIQRDYAFSPQFERAKDLLEENDGAGNTFKATAKPVLIGTAVVGATTLIFSIIVSLTHGLQPALVTKLSLLHPPFLLGLITGGAVIHWFVGASTQAVTTGAYRAVEFIKANMNLESAAAASIEDSKKVVEICTRYAQKGMFNIFLTVFFSTLAFAFVEPYFFIGYLISIALFGLYQAIFMANAGGAWDNAKKIVEVELKQKGTELHAATVVGDTVGDPFKDTSSVALNPIIKFTTLFGLLAVELAVSLTEQRGPGLSHALAAGFLLVSMFFVHRSFYGMRIEQKA